MWMCRKTEQILWAAVVEMLWPSCVAFTIWPLSKSLKSLHFLTLNFMDKMFTCCLIYPTHTCFTCHSLLLYVCICIESDCVDLMDPQVISFYFKESETSVDDLKMICLRHDQINCLSAVGHRTTQVDTKWVGYCALHRWDLVLLNFLDMCRRVWGEKFATKCCTAWQF